MSLYFKAGLKVRISQLDGDNAPRPLPLSSGFTEASIYEVLGMHIPAETGEAWLILKNDRDEMWFISNRHVRIVAGGSVDIHRRNGKTGTIVEVKSRP
jgi:hypothetical protein